MTFKNLEVDGRNYWWHYFFTPTLNGYTLEVMPEREPIRKVRKFYPGKERPLKMEELITKLTKKIL